MSFTKKLCLLVGFVAAFYFLLFLASFGGTQFFGAYMFTDIGIIFFILLVFFEIYFVTM
ncbi:MAG: hypothetical protein JW772_00865 [Candidatus Diapherotrites archaeon]|nr:hypothetical protein [Candidatus Diapherotrites archaeon]